MKTKRTYLFAVLFFLYLWFQGMGLVNAQTLFNDSTVYFTFRYGPHLDHSQSPRYFKEILRLDSNTASKEYYTVQRFREVPAWDNRDSLIYHLTVVEDKVYYTGPIEGNSNQPAYNVLIYDFGLQAGDTMSASAGSLEYSLVVDSVVNTEYIDGQTHLTQFVTAYEGENEFEGYFVLMPSFRMIKGIGSDFGLLPFRVVWRESWGIELISACHSDAIIYQNSRLFSDIEEEVCDDSTMRIAIDKFSSVEQTGHVSSISVYPNPVSDVLYIDVPSKGTYEIFSGTGQLLKNGILKSELQLDDLKPQLLHLVIATEEGVYRSTLIKE